MKMQEYQAKALLAQFGVPTPKGIVCTTPEEVRAAAESLGGGAVVKAQVLAGGRGKAGAVKVAKTAEADVSDVHGLPGRPQNDARWTLRGGEHRRE